MDSEQFRRCAKELVDYAINYMETIRSRPVLPDVEPGYMQDLLPGAPPEKPEHWKDIIKDIDKIIMPGMTHWNSPHFHAYFPTANSYPAMCADILASALTCIGFTWMSSPVCTELEMVMMDWLGGLLQLPEEFLYRSKGLGGGVIQGTASEATLVSLLGARNKVMMELSDNHPGGKPGALGKLVAYASDQSHSSVERAALLGAVRIRLLESDENGSLRGHVLSVAIDEDRENGYIPFFVCATLGSTNTCSFDNLKEIGSVCTQEKIWLHVDAAYAGSAFICPEYRPLLDGVEDAETVNFNPHKWMLVNFDCSAMWMKNRRHITDAFSVNPVYLKHDKEGQVPDFRHWQIPLGRRFRSLKLWFVFRMYGVEGLRNHIRKQIRLAQQFERLVNEDKRFEIVAPVLMGLVCFRYKGTDEVNERLLKGVNDRKKIHMTPTRTKDQFMLRMAVCSRLTEPEDMVFAWKEVQLVAAELRL